MYQTTIEFKKIGKTYPISNITSELDITISDMSEFVFAKTNVLNLFFTKDGNYTQFGKVEKKRIKYHATTTGFSDRG